MRCTAHELIDTFAATGVCERLGAWLVRIEMREALPILAARLPDLTTAGPVTFRPHIGITGPVTLPLRFTASP